MEFLWELRPGWQADGLCLEYPELTWFLERGQSSAPAKAVSDENQPHERLAVHRANVGETAGRVDAAAVLAVLLGA